MRYTTVLGPMLKRSGFYLSSLRYWLLIAIALVSHAVLAFSSGELKLLSSAQEPLRAEILLPRTAQGDPYEIVNVAVPPEATFAQAGLKHSEYLYQLKLSPMLIGGGLLIEISAPQPLNNQVDLLLEFTTSSQQYIHYYSLGQQGLPIQESVETLNSNNINNNLGGQDDSDSTSDSRVHKVVQGDTLWNIAKRLRPQGLTVAETMNQLFAANPNAFQNGDSTQIKLGFLLKFNPDPIVKPKDNKTALFSEQTASIPRVEVKAPTIESVAETPSSIEPVAGTLNNEEAMQEVLQELAEEFADQSQSEATPDDQFTSVIPQQVSAVSDSQPSVTAFALENPVLESQLAVPEKRSEEQPLKEQSPIETGKKVMTELTQLTSRIKAMLDWQFVHDPIDDYRQYLTFPWIAGALLALAFITLLIKLLFKPSPRNKKQIEQSQDDLTETDKELIDSPAEPMLDDIPVVHDEPALDDSPAIYAQRDSDFIDNSASQSQHRDAYPQPPIHANTDENVLGEQAIAFPGLEELDAQMREEFLVEQHQSGDYQLADNSEDMDDIDPHKVRLDMATICMEMNDNDAAREILLEIINEAEEPAKAEAQAMLESLNSQISG